MDKEKQTIKRIGLDTSAIGYCLKKNLSAKDLKEFLSEKNLTPAVCAYVTYELSRTFRGDIKKAEALFCFISDLQPQYIARAEVLYLRELDRLNRNSAFGDLMEEPTERQMSKMIEAHARGDITEDLRTFINGRQDFLDFARREFFKPSAVEKEKIRQYKDSSASIEALFLRLKEGDVSVIKCLKDIILVATNGKAQLSDDDILEIFYNSFNCRALRSLIRNLYHLHFLTHKNGDTPNENRLTDGRVMIEYSYCDQFLSHDTKLVETHALAINPDISPIHASEFLKDLMPA